MLGDLNSDVGEALRGERARLSHHGYPEDLPLPALWWEPTRGAARATGERRLVALDGCSETAG
jgi:hypothetical protein